MKYFIILTIFLKILILSTNANAQKLIPLQDYINKNEFNDNEMFYVFSRCSAIGYKIMDLGQNMPELKKRGETLNGYFFYVSSEVRSKILPNESKKRHEAITAETVGGLVDVYTEISNDYYLRTGNYFSDMMIADLELCSALYERQ